VGQVRLDHVCKTYDGHIVVNDVSFQIEDKEFVVLVGPSGCGKSTTLRMIAGLEEISGGSIFIDQQIVNDIPPKDRDIAMVFQNYALYPHMTVYDNLAFGLRMRKYSRSDIEVRVTEAAEILGISPLLKRKPLALSGGQRQRVALGRAIVRRPKVFLFDEPLSNLDANLRVQMRTEISRLHKQLQTTMIYVTHDQIEAMSMGDRIVVLNNGIVQQIDTPLTIYNKPANQFVAGFMGSPTMNFFPGTLRGADPLHFSAGNGLLSLALTETDSERLAAQSNQPVVLGIRPEHILAHPNSSAASAVQAVIEVTEPVGNEIFLYFTLGTGQDHYTSRIPSDIMPRVRVPFTLYFDSRKFHFFDPSTGHVL
jgi:multiple sugar transport system ATP-binding protein